MADQVCIGGGGQDGWLQLSAQQVLQGFGYDYNASDPLQATYQSIGRTRNPYASGTKWYAPFMQYAEACMRARAILFCNQTAGDCQTGRASISGATPAFADVETLIGASGSIAGPVGSAIAADVNTIVNVFAAHAQAVARQASALCTLAPEFSQAIYQIDSGVSAGLLTPQQGAAAVTQLVSSWQASVGTLAKNCNAFCMYAALILCLADITPYYYAGLQQISVKNYPPPTSPIVQQSPVVSPTVTGIQSAPQAMPAPTVTTGLTTAFSGLGGVAPSAAPTQSFVAAPASSMSIWLIVLVAGAFLLFLIAR